MNLQERKPIVILEDDYNLLKQYIGPVQHDMSLSAELKRATVVSREDFPKYTVRLNSKVMILELMTGKVKEFTIVMPAHADINNNKVSILTPMGAALIGYRKGDEVEWRVPARLTRFRILDVVNKEQ